MNLVKAIHLDRTGDTQAAAEAYELLLASDVDGVEAFVNLIVLYWQMTDVGYSSENHISPERVSEAGRRLRVLLDSGSKFRLRSQFKFWRNYIAWCDLGEEFEVEQCRRLLRSDPAFLDPAMYIFARSNGSECVAEAHDLYDQCLREGTVRARYIVSMLEAVMRNNGLTDLRDFSR